MNRFIGSERIEFPVADEPDDGIADTENEHDDADNPADGRVENEPANHLVDREQGEEHAEPNEGLRVEQCFSIRRFRKIGTSFIDEVSAEGKQDEPDQNKLSQVKKPLSDK